MTKKRAHRKTTKTASASDKRYDRRKMLIIGGVVVLVVAVVVGVVLARRGEQSAAPTMVYVMYHGIPGGFTEEGFPYLGSPGAKVVLTEFTDLYCSHCRSYNLESEDDILGEYVLSGKVRYVAHYYSIGSPQSLQATEAAMCAGDQGLYFQFQRSFFEHPVAKRDDFIAIARQVGADEETFAECWDSGRHRNELMAFIREAKEIGVSGTPTFLVNEQLVVGDRPDLLRQTIDDAIAAVR